MDRVIPIKTVDHLTESAKVRKDTKRYVIHPSSTTSNKEITDIRSIERPMPVKQNQTTQINIRIVPSTPDGVQKGDINEKKPIFPKGNSTNEKIVYGKSEPSSVTIATVGKRNNERKSSPTPIYHLKKSNGSATSSPMGGNDRNTFSYNTYFNETKKATGSHERLNRSISRTSNTSLDTSPRPSYHQKTNSYSSVSNQMASPNERHVRANSVLTGESLRTKQQQQKTRRNNAPNWYPTYMKFDNQYIRSGQQARKSTNFNDPNRFIRPIQQPQKQMANEAKDLIEVMKTQKQMRNKFNETGTIVEKEMPKTKYQENSVRVIKRSDVPQSSIPRFKISEDEQEKLRESREREREVDQTILSDWISKRRHQKSNSVARELQEQEEEEEEKYRQSTEDEHLHLSRADRERETQRRLSNENIKETAKYINQFYSSSNQIENYRSIE
ncbi:hypothetical protein SNEBB_006839 [Seison nebaliae]|nr:hypothetical protein SNEBB_006839 [Seison nebaliae]